MLAVNFDRRQFGEVVATDAERCTLLLPDGRESFCRKAELGSVFTPVMAWKVIKVDGSWIYLADGPKHARNTTGLQVFSRTGIHV